MCVFTKQYGLHKKILKLLHITYLFIFTIKVEEVFRVKNLKIIWIYRLGLLLLVFLCLLVFLKIKPLWAPIIFVCKVAITPFLIACFIAYLLHPLIEKFIKKGCRAHSLFCSFTSFSLAELVMEFIKERRL